jgi:hypothetical protein
MKTTRSSGGLFRERPYYEQSEIEKICTDELRAIGLLPQKPEPVRIDYFIEKKFGIVPGYEDLPDGVLGYSRFGEKGLEAVIVARSLDEQPTLASERVLRTTLAHEVGHALLQGHLFALGKKPANLFEDGIDEPKILCRKSGYDGKWWEFQANRAIGSLLLPQSLVEDAITELLTKTGTFGMKTLESDQRAAAIAVLARTFNVNPAAAQTRIGILYPLATGGQLTL